MFPEAGEGIIPVTSKSGFGWVTHREFFNSVGLDKRNFMGGGDASMLGAFAQASNPWWVIHDCKTYGNSHIKFWEDYKIRVRALAAKLGKENTVSHVPGHVFHLNHGSPENRKYAGRAVTLHREYAAESDDVFIDDIGLLQFNDIGKAKGLPEFLSKYSASREEDEFINDYSKLIL